MYLIPNFPQTQVFELSTQEDRKLPNPNHQGSFASLDTRLLQMLIKVRIILQFSVGFSYYLNLIKWVPTLRNEDTESLSLIT